MANEIQLKATSTQTIYAVISNQTSGYMWNGAAFEAFTSGNWANYAISLVEQGVAGRYVGNFPTLITAGIYSVDARQQTLGSPTQRDPTVAVGDINWNGTVTVPLSDLVTSGQLGTFAPIRMARGNAISGFMIDLVSSADHITPLTSGVVSGQISRNGGSFGPLQSGTFTEVGLGFYSVNLTSGDLNATTAALVVTAQGISGGVSDPRRLLFVLQKTSGQQ